MRKVRLFFTRPRELNIITVLLILFVWFLLYVLVGPKYEFLMDSEGSTFIKCNKITGRSVKYYVLPSKVRLIRM